MERLLTAAEVGEKFRVHQKTIRRWAMAGKIPSVRTPGGGHRFRPADVERMLAEQNEPART